jgi:hypothetical protein
MPTRLATLDDVPELVRVINRAYEVEAGMFVDKRTHDADVRERLARPNACILVVDDDGSNGRVLAGAVYVETRGERGYFARSYLLSTRRSASQPLVPRHTPIRLAP